jgi:hypothetical protein
MGMGIIEGFGVMATLHNFYGDLREVGKIRWFDFVDCY